jgi:C4-dicarboxylate-specific signal transduction histidine kinase
MNEKQRLEFLEERLDYLQHEKNETLKALESVLEVDDLSVSLNKLKDSRIIIDRAYRKISKLIKIKTAGFLLVDESSGLFSPSWFSDEESREDLMAETDRLIMDNTFALAVKANRCITVKSKKLGGVVLIHALSTVSRTRGMFVSVLNVSKEDVPDAVFSLITIVMNSTAHLLESFELYSRNRVANDLLSKSVKRLEQSETYLKSFNEKLEAEVESRTKELKATNSLLENEVSERKKIEKLLVQQKDALENLNETLENRVAVETENRRKSEQVLHEQSKLAAMGQMLSAISHQWRQPLNSLGMIVQDILDEFDEKGVSREYLEDAVSKSVKLIIHMSTTIDDFCDLVKSGGETEEFNLYHAVNEVSGLVEEHYNEAGIFIDIHCKDADGDCADFLVSGDSGVFKQVMLNILSNSKDAIIERLDSGRIAKGSIDIDLLSEGSSLNVMITDNGGGISESILSRVFEPYFTTKESKKGTGIGLYMSKIFIEEHMKGKISISNFAEGAQIIINLDKAS